MQITEIRRGSDNKSSEHAEIEGMQVKFSFQKRGFGILKAYACEGSTRPPFRFICLGHDVSRAPRYSLGHNFVSRACFWAHLTHISTGYVIKQWVHALSCTPSSCDALEVSRTLNKLELLQAISEHQLLRFFVLLRWYTLEHAPVVKFYTTTT